MSDKYRPDGTPYPEGHDGLMEWAKDIEDRSKKIVKQETLPNGLLISTVWLGLDHQFGDGPPLIFETMVFPAEGYCELDMDRYSTREEAEAGHERIKKKFMEGAA